MTILAIDPGSNCGWAILSDLGIVSGVWYIAPRRGESPGMRYRNLRAELNKTLEAWPGISLLVYEQAHNRGGAATEYANAMVGLFQEWCLDKGIDHTSLHSGTVKKLAFGSGKAKKEEMLEAAQSKWPGYRFVDDNEVDARWIAVAAHKQLGGE